MKRIALVRPPRGTPGPAVSAPATGDRAPGSNPSVAASFFSSSPSPVPTTTSASPTGRASAANQKPNDGDEDPSASFLAAQIREIFSDYNHYVDYECDRVVGPGAFSTDERDARWDNGPLPQGAAASIASREEANASLLQDLLNVKRHPLSDFYPLPLEAIKRKTDKDALAYTENDFLEQLGALSDPPEDGRKGAAILEIDSYTSIVEAEREQPFLIGLLQPLPHGLEVVLSIDNWRLRSNCDADATLLKGVLPPLSAGRHFLSVCTRSGYPLALLLRSTQTDEKEKRFKDEFKRIAPVFHMPLMVVRAPRRRQDPQLCYSTLKQGAPLPATGPYTAADLDALVAASGVMNGAARFVVPRSQGNGPAVDRDGRLVALPKGEDFTARLAECLESATKPKNVPVFGAPETVLVDSAYNCDVRIPLPFKVSLFNSCAATSRLSIACFHSRVFEFEPYGVLSAHIFTKSCYSDIYTIFGFTLTPAEAAPHTALKRNRARASFTPGLDRFEATERLCADTRFWRYVDGCVPCKNDVAAKFVIEDFDRLECPVPPVLRHARNPYAEYPEGLQIAPGVVFFFEPWPDDVLPVPKRFAGDAYCPASAAAAMQSVDATVSHKSKQTRDAGKEEPAGAPPRKGQPKRDPQFFSVTLCIGKYIFNSVLGVEAGVLEFIVNRWLGLVPEKGSPKK
ncbi:conserved hypothetical protein [Neospora caninum Liverpool]|uniref:Uncharacterized protein n=1 Tax=Neospora caninum (strain Liverpool) TaxID=572307 RepID=F0VIL4_NEOCL|nr:conserved hypothetical protein [Neospora caninum Liverpool]CBZ53575.1 conserved hypothetical protein [Neospora caninum Liverpool]CEL67563.1 TPA: hypothetical protein BN1204_033620 [Neospora caninum Liverpool]|eukprot:XP_003883607.1 conserved hypothetical protein [Neospora caninum Liverpool]